MVPKDYIKAGGLAGLKIVFLIDLVLGPLLTFVVFNKNKKRLWLDLSIIGFIQLAGLASERLLGDGQGSDCVPEWYYQTLQRFLTGDPIGT